MFVGSYMFEARASVLFSRSLARPIRGLFLTMNGSGGGGGGEQVGRKKATRQQRNKAI